MVSLLFQEAQTYAEENGLFFMETSAKTASNVNDFFSEIGNHLHSLCCVMGCQLAFVVDHSCLCSYWPTDITMVVLSILNHYLYAFCMTCHEWEQKN